MSSSSFDAVIVGGGLYGCMIAIHVARRRDARVVVVERDEDILLRASYGNQARVHNGYHYPRSLRTGLSSHLNYGRFVEEFADCVTDSFEQYYGIASRGSNVTAGQFERFCRRVGAPLREAPDNVRRLFDPSLVERVYRVEECAFDALALRSRIRADLERAGVELRLGTEVEAIDLDGRETPVVRCRGPNGEVHLPARRVFNCTYSRLNRLLRSSGLQPIPLNHEVAEIALVRVPEVLEGVGITVMCGPFFSLMPFPAKGLHSLSHVRYTPHFAWTESRHGAKAPDGAENGWSDPYHVLRNYEKGTRFEHMRRDGARYLPALADCRHVESLWEVKSVLPRSETDDSRPILLRISDGAPPITNVLGAKIDNVYDVLEALRL